MAMTARATSPMSWGAATASWHRQPGHGAPAPAGPAAPPVRHNLPALLTRVLGRADAIEAVALQVPMRRCVTIAGPGGIGKTTVAIAAAEKLLAVYDDGVWFIDLAVVTDRS